MLWWALRQSRSTRPETREKGAAALARYRGDRTRARLEELLSDPSARVRCQAARGLAATGGPSAVPLIEALLASDPYPAVWRAAGEALATLKWRPTTDRLAVRVAIARGRVQDATALGPRAASTLLEILQTRGWDFDAYRKQALTALEGIGDPAGWVSVEVADGRTAADVLLRMLSDQDGNLDVRLRAGAILAAAGDGRAAEPALAMLVGVRDGRTEILAARMLTALGDRRGIRPILDLWREAAARQDGYSAGAFQKSLLAFPDAADEVPADMVTDANEYVRMATVDLLAVMGGPRIIELLPAAVADPSPRVRRQAAEVLARSGYRPAGFEDRVRYAAVREDWATVAAEGPAAAAVLLDLWAVLGRDHNSGPDEYANHYQFAEDNLGFLRAVAAAGEPRAAALLVSAFQMHLVDDFSWLATHRSVITEGLIRVGDAAAPRLASLLIGDARGWVMKLDEAVVDLLCRIGSPAAVEPLLKYLVPHHRSAADHAARVLQRILSVAAGGVPSSQLRTIAAIRDQSPPSREPEESSDYVSWARDVTVNASGLRGLAKRELARRGEGE